jgi:branched-chain amino acid transport system ATP-binding protein
MTARLLDIAGLETFYGASRILTGLSLAVGDGEQLALVGRNGMGKTTLIRSIMGLAADRRGVISLAGQDVTRALPEAVAMAGVAYVPEGRGVFGSLSVIENLVMAARPGRNGRRGWTLDRVLSVFPRLAQRRGHGGQALSGGEQQMLAIGRALMTNPRLLLIDEATEGLAPLVAQDIWRTIGTLRDEGIATIVVDKDVRSLARVVDRIAVMSKGAIVFEGGPAALLANPALLDQYLGV